ncbi:glycosyltransferase family 4 protein [Aestuariivivens sediminicola]|uniref:glycosyltransferase family 4 protein n=1 Tax=Aestuariivivens sediminicola TaxID=2913560 RepID=UPI001F5663D8|nr:glycosyltransferase family 4 protein [Aestuariivivens sediminicola]
MKDILIITNYFPPEIGAASNRIHQLATGLHQNGFKVSVVTPLPNYPNGRILKAYRGAFKRTTVENGLTVHRLWLYASHSKNKLLRLASMLSYSMSLIRFFIRNRNPSTVIIQSPPLIVAFISVLFLRSRKRKLILNVSDLWPLAGLELGALKKGVTYRLLERMERYNYRHTDLILGQSEEILTHIASVYPEKHTLLYRNYPDFTPPELREKQRADRKIKLAYAGLLGVAQGIYRLCWELDYSKVEFHIYGAGSEQAIIEQLIKDRPELDIHFYGTLTRPELHRVLMTYDVAIIPLLKRIYGSVPSKIFEYARLGLPILYFGGGEGELIVEEHGLGWVAKAGDYNDLNKVLGTISLADLNAERILNTRQTAITKFDAGKQLHALTARVQ